MGLDKYTKYWEEKLPEIIKHIVNGVKNYEIDIDDVLDVSGRETFSSKEYSIKNGQYKHNYKRDIHAFNKDFVKVFTNTEYYKTHLFDKTLAVTSFKNKKPIMTIKIVKEDIKNNYFKQLVEQYKVYLDETQNKEEDDKWLALDHFQKHWDIEADDFEKMFKKAFNHKGKDFLIYQLSWGVINHAARIAPEEIRSMFRALYNEETDIAKRIEDFKKEADRLSPIIKQSLEEGGKREKGKEFKHNQDERSISMYLAFRYPEKYFIYKAGFYKDLCRNIGKKPKSKIEGFLDYSLLAEDFKKNYLFKAKFIIDFHKNLHPNLNWNDSNLIVQNIFFRMIEHGGKKQENNYKQELINVLKKIDDLQVIRDYFHFIHQSLKELGVNENNDRLEFKTSNEQLLFEIDHRIIMNLKKKVNKISADYLIAPNLINSLNEEFQIGKSKFSPKENKQTPYYVNFLGDKENFPFVDINAFKTSVGYQFSLNAIHYRNKRVPSNPYFEACVFYPDTLDEYLKLAFPEIKNMNSELNKEVSYYWLNANPNHWDIDDLKTFDEIEYTTHTIKGTKRRIYKYMQELNSGDKVIGYVTTPIKKVRAFLTVISSTHINDEDEEVFTMKLNSFTDTEPSWEELKDISSLKDAEIFRNNQGSLFKLTKDEYETIRTICYPIIEYPKYSRTNLLREVFINSDQLKTINGLLIRKLNIILQGPPGTGKTFLAKRLAYCIMGEKNPNRVKMIQFHQSYSYEDFVQGYRPTNDGRLILQSGVLYDFATKAASDQMNPYFLIIDEINRGNLSKIFGELMLLIEADKRVEKVSLTYSSKEKEFYLPKNLHIIGTMNTADRSLALVDYALRRRFAFIDMKPHFGEKFEKHLKEVGFKGEIISDISSKLSKLNEVIMNDPSLSEDFLIGHSYFITNSLPKDQEQWKREIFEFEIIPLLKEYWFDNETNYKDAKELLGIE